MAKSFVSVVLRQETVDVVEFARSLGGTRILKSARADVTEGNVPAAIRGAMAQAGIEATRVAVALPPHEVLLRAFSIPALPRAEVDTAVQFEARKYVPFKLSDLVWDYMAVPRSDEQLTVIFAAMERAALSGAEAWIRDAGLEPLCMEPSSISLARAVQGEQPERTRRTVAAVEVVGNAAHIAVVRDGNVYLAREVRLTDERNESGAGEADRASDARASRLASELRLSLQFFARAFADICVEQVVLFGEPQLVASWCPELAAALGCVVEPGHAPDAEAGATALPSAVGLALRHGAKGSPFDFLGRNSQTAPAAARGRLHGDPVVQHARQMLASLNRPVLGLFAAASLALVAVLWVAGARQVALEDQRLESLSRDRPDVGFGLAERTAEELEPLRQRLEEQLALLRRVIEARAPVASKLDTVARELPDGVWLTSLSYENPLSVNAQGKAILSVQGACYLGEEGRELSTIRQLEETLKGHEAFNGFASSQLQEISVQSDRQQQYTYRTFRVDYRPERRL